MSSSESTMAGGGPSIAETVHVCLQAQVDRGLMERSIKQLRSYLVEFADTCAHDGVTAPNQLTPALVSDYVQDRCRGRGPAVLKACVWAMRTLGGYLMLKGMVAAHPAAALRTPIPARAQLPQYLTPAQLRRLLDTAARERTPRDVVLLALISSSGLRPHEIVGLERADLHRNERWLDVLVKGGWRKATPFSPAMARMLGDYLDSREDNDQAAFVGMRGRPISVRWLQRMVAEAGEQADLPVRLS